MDVAKDPYFAQKRSYLKKGEETLILVFILPFFSSSSSNSSSRKEEGSAPSNSFIPSFPRAPSTSDSVRVKCREMLSAALRTGGELYGTVFSSLTISFSISVFPTLLYLLPCRVE